MADAIDVWRIDLEAMPALAACDLSPLSVTEQSRLRTFVNPEPARRYALCRLALRDLLGAGGAASGAAIEIVDGPHGKPGSPIAGAPHFNVSHADRIALIAISSTHEVGIDIEPRSSFFDTVRMQARICSTGERHVLKARPTRADELFGELWTRKEAILKALGVGLTMAPADLDLAPQIDAEEGAIKVPNARDGAAPVVRWRMVPALADHVGAVAALLPHDSAPLVVNVRPFESGRLKRVAGA